MSERGGHRLRWTFAVALLSVVLGASLLPLTGVVVAQEAGESDYEPVNPTDAQRTACDVLGCETPTTLPEPPSGDVPDLPGVPAFFDELIIGLLVIALSAALFLTTRTILRNRRGEDGNDEEDDAVDAVDVVTGTAIRRRPRSAGEWLDAAEQAARSGDWSKALRYLHRSGLLRLDEGGFLRFRKGRTNGEYALMLSGRSPAAASSLRRLSRTVEDVQFGERPATEEMYGPALADWTALSEALSADATQGGTVAGELWDTPAGRDGRG